MSYSWKDQVVLITGGATGIGADVVKLIVDEGSEHVAVLDVDEKAGNELQESLNSKHGNNKVKFYKCDVTNEDVFLGIFKTVKDEFGYIDVVINNAGIMNDRLSVYKKEIEINVTALVTGTLKAIEYMSKNKGGKGGTVINISSIAGIAQSPLLPIYYATKTAVLQFSNCIGMQEYYGKTGVRVLAICFGATSTPLLSKQKLGSSDPDFEDTMLELLKTFTYQTSQEAAKGLVDAYKQGASGSTWIVLGGETTDISSDIQKGFQIMSSKMK